MTNRKETKRQGFTNTNQQKKADVNPVEPEGWAVPASLMTPVVLLLRWDYCKFQNIKNRLELVYFYHAIGYIH